MSVNRKSIRGQFNGASVLALAVCALLPTSAMAQDAANEAQDAATQPAAEATDADDGDVIIVTGTRNALKTSQQIKRNADTVVDSITANDIGAFPDKSVAEALQRVPGITVNRLAASDDTSHFSADPSGVLIRGLSQVRSEYNGRDTFSANSSRGLSWADIAPELMAGVDVYKNQTAQLIEGGIAGSINLRTRVPFDEKGQVIQVNLGTNYGDLRKKWNPDVSALYSNRWSTEIGDIGILLDGAFSKVSTESQGVTYGRTAVFQDVYGPGRQYIPSSAGYRLTDYDRTRKGFAGAIQWRSADEKVLATVQYNRSKYHETWKEHGVISYLTDLFAFPADFVFTNGGPNSPRIPRPAPGSDPFTFDGNGNFVSGTLINQQTDFSWWGGAAGPNFTGVESGSIALNDQGEPMLLPCYSWGNADNTTPGSCGADARGPDFNAVTRYNDLRRMTQDVGFNLRWNPNEKLELSFDAQYVDSDLKNYDVEVGQYSYANVTLDASGGRPRLTFSDPTNINQSAGGLTNPNNYRYNHAMDHVEDDDGKELALRVDGSYDLGGSWLDSLHFGGRFADRDQTVRYSAYNWGNIANHYNTWGSQYLYWNIDSGPAPSIGFTGYPSGLIDERNFGASYFGGSGDYVFFDMDALRNHRVDELSYSNLGVGQDLWEPVCSNGGTAQTGPRTAEIPGTCFRPDEINKLSETTKAAYLMLKFGGRDAMIGNVGVSGNVGLRYVETVDKVRGSTVFPLIDPAANSCTRNVTIPGDPPTTPYSVGCYIFGNADLIANSPPPPGFVDTPLAGSPNVINFANGAGEAGSFRTVHHNWLPSFNLRLDLTRNLILRFAASRAMSRPDIGLLKNYTTIAASLPGADPNDPRYIKNGTGQIIGVAPVYTGSGYNPRLKPTTADMFDLSIEHYFADVGQFSAGLFYKKFHNYVQYGSTLVDFTNNGVTETVEVRGPQNGKGGKLWGLEGTYQRFFDFLPGALSGLGVQLNGTYVKNKGITNSGLKNQNGSDGGGQQQPGTGGTTLSVNSLEGLSKYAFNVVGMYEKYGLALRVAYNWRSKFLVTAVDCCTYLPAWQMASGQLDASIRYAVTPNVELSVQGSNLLNTEVRLKQQVTSADNGSVLVPNSWFQNDRRFQFGVRAKF